MVTRTTTYDYEVSSESGRERHVRIPYASLEDATPTLHDPFQVANAGDGLGLNGTVITLDAVDSVIIGNVAEGAVYLHNVRNVRTYTSGPVAEATWAAIVVGMRVYYDTEQDTLNGVKLSLAPLQSDGTTPNDPFGWIVMDQDEDSSDFGKGTSQVGSTHACAVLQGH